MRRERTIKALSRKRKLALIAAQPMGDPKKLKNEERDDRINKNRMDR
jgi:predicted GIY-YIG superfamily endonuclease